MDALHRQLFTTLLGDHWTYGIEAAVDVTLVGRYYERFADHAVSVARGSSTWSPASGSTTTSWPNRHLDAVELAEPSRRQRPWFATACDGRRRGVGVEVLARPAGSGCRSASSR